MRYHFKITKEKNGYSAECVELKGCVTEADTLPEIEKNMHEALNLYLDEPADSKAILALPKKNVKGRNVHPVDVDVRVAFAFTLRRARLTHKWTQKRAAQELNFGSLYSYQRLESAKTTNPALETIAKVVKVFPELSIDEIFKA